MKTQSGHLGMRARVHAESYRLEQVRKVDTVRRRRAGGMAAGLVLLGALTACGGQSMVTEGDVTLLVHNDSLLPQGGTDAQITGAVALGNGCVGLVSEAEPDQVQAVIWPSGTAIDEVDPLKLRLPSGVLVTEGTLVQGAGGYSKDTTRLEVEIPSSCDFDSDQEIAMFNPDDDPIVLE